MSVLAGRVARAGLGLLLGLVLLEAALQLLAAGGRLVREERAAEPTDDAELVILCVGDSHTFGFNVDAQGTWPARLEALLIDAGVDARVVNRGLPGKNTRTMLAELPVNLARYRPDLVLILGGVNNPWSGLGADRDEPGWYESLRSWRLFRIVYERIEGTPSVDWRPHDGGLIGAAPNEYVTEDRPDGTTVVVGRTREGDAEQFVLAAERLSMERELEGMVRIVDDVLAMADLCLAADAQPVLLSYAADWEDTIARANAAIREVRNHRDLPLVDWGSFMRIVVEEFPEQDLFFEDAHPRRLGYEVLARRLFDELADAGELPTASGADPLGLLRAADAPSARLRLAEGAPALLASYEPGLPFRVLLARATAPPVSLLGLEVPLAADELLAASQDHELLHGHFGDASEVRVELPAELLGEGPVHAALLVHTPGFRGVAVSAALRVR